LSPAFFASTQVFARKWRHRMPVATPCVIIKRARSIHLLGNAENGSIAYARRLSRQVSRLV
jgi:hypothetical protein